MGRKPKKKAAAACTAPTHWWQCIDDEDPITLEPISALGAAPFVLGGTFFDAATLAGYLLESGRLENPLTREPLLRCDCKALDAHLLEWTFVGGRRLEQLWCLEQDAGREAGTLSAALFDYEAAPGGPAVVDDDEAPFARAEADAGAEAFPALLRSGGDTLPAPPVLEGFRDLALAAAAEDEAAA
eukprot:CAMPEP_0119294002 /NCGR_PEP_ID=MMETSP1329-20130426/47095_1 /TAXON_ID=114041 /ORGANISM="Genus nov. species nov., Strain RCC1024" /LENGTH=184 /DNA_ID=CAMNT_0007294881 /DNA_START=102 /DNA_END=653 /DNA_ORIENTATION=-